MRIRLMNSTHHLSIIAVLTLTMANSAAIASEEASSSIVCAQREALLMTLVEAHGAAPNIATDRLSREAFKLAQMRAACDNRHANEALVFYDRLIVELTASSAAHPEQVATQAAR